MSFRYNYNEVEITITIISHPSPIEQVYIVGIYRSKTKVKLSKYIEALDYLQTTQLANKAAIVFGDFNVDLSKIPMNVKLLIQKWFNQKVIPNLLTIIQPTTEHKLITYIQIFLR